MSGPSMLFSVGLLDLDAYLTPEIPGKLHYTKAFHVCLVITTHRLAPLHTQVDLIESADYHRWYG